MDEINLPDAIEPTEWFVVFHTVAPNRWLSWLACGRFKHVSAFAYCPGFKAWLLYDTQLNGTRIMLFAHGEAAKAMLARYTHGCSILKIARNFEPHGLALSSRLGFYCVPAIKHLLGLPCVAARPDALYRHILRHGGVRIHEEQHAGNPDRPQPRDRATASAQRSDRLAANADAR